MSINSIVEQGDTLASEKKTYARIKFSDGSEVNMRPGTQLNVSQYNFDQGKPQDDKIVMNMVKGGMRAVTGMIGKRGDQDSYKVMTNTAVVGIRGTTYECKICEGNCGSIPNGLYLFVLEGTIRVSNDVGAQNLSAGQYGYVQTLGSVPQVLPGNPGVDFTRPTFKGETPREGEPKQVDPGCIVR